MKTAAIWFGALILGFLGGIAGHRFSIWQTMPELTSPRRAHSFELLDRAGDVVSVWTTDPWGRPILKFGDAKWEARILIGPLNQADVDVIPKEPPDPNAAWGVLVRAPGDAAHAALGTAIDTNTKKPAGFADWR
jgi:hypothetical protein